MLIGGKRPLPEAGPKLLLGVNILLSFQGVVAFLIIKAPHKALKNNNKDPSPKRPPLYATAHRDVGPRFGWDQTGMLDQSSTFTLDKRWDP